MGDAPTQQARPGSSPAPTGPETGPNGAPATVPGPARAPLILTLELADPAQDLFGRLREQHFPPERNFIPAHVSLFHALPGAERDAVQRRLGAVQDTRFPVTVSEPFGLGRGVAFRLRSPVLDALRARLAADWASWLTPQDRQNFRAHVTVQNKVSPDEAKRLLSRLRHGFDSFDTEAVALRLWRYLGGPWEALHRHQFADPAPEPAPEPAATRPP